MRTQMSFLDDFCRSFSCHNQFLSYNSAIIHCKWAKEFIFLKAFDVIRDVISIKQNEIERETAHACITHGLLRPKFWSKLPKAFFLAGISSNWIYKPWEVQFITGILIFRDYSRTYWKTETFLWYSRKNWQEPEKSLQLALILNDCWH